MAKKDDTTAPTEHPLWTQIKNVKVDMFSLPGQQAHMFCSPVPIPGDKLFLKIRVPAFIPALETALGPGWLFETTDLYTVISKIEKKE